MYGWVTLIDGMADGDMTKWEHFYKMNHIEFLNMAQYRIVKQEERETEMQLERLKHKR